MRIRIRSARVLFVVAAASMAVGTSSALAALAAPAAKVPGLSHQLCYAANATGFKKVPKVVELSDVFDPKGFIPKIGKAVLNCNPVRETLPSGKAFPVTDPAGHLACFTIKAAREKLPAVTIKNQFGHATLRIGQPKLLCLPTWQGQRKPPKPRSVQPPGLDHFTCYPVTKALGKYRVPRVGLKDAFARKAVHPHVKAVPSMLCATTLEIVGTRFSKVFHPGAYLTCFPSGKTPVKRKVFGLNQFGRAVVAIHKTSVLCLPSLSGR